MTDFELVSVTDSDRWRSILPANRSVFGSLEYCRIAEMAGAGVPRLFAHSGSDTGYYCFTAGSMERRSGLMVMLNGDGYVPFLMKLLANPSGPAPALQTIWPNFARRFFTG